MHACVPACVCVHACMYSCTADQWATVCFMTESVCSLCSGPAGALEDAHSHLLQLMQEVGGPVSKLTPGQVLLVARAGSFMYGLSTPDSDVDYVVVYRDHTEVLLPLSLLLSLLLSLSVSASVSLCLCLCLSPSLSLSLPPPPFVSSSIILSCSVRLCPSLFPLHLSLCVLSLFQSVLSTCLQPMEFSLCFSLYSAHAIASGILSVSVCAQRLLSASRML